MIYNLKKIIIHISLKLKKILNWWKIVINICQYAARDDKQDGGAVFKML